MTVTSALAFAFSGIITSNIARQHNTLTILYTLFFILSFLHNRVAVFSSLSISTVNHSYARQSDFYGHTEIL